MKQSYATAQVVKALHGPTGDGARSFADLLAAELAVEEGSMQAQLIAGRPLVLAHVRFGADEYMVSMVPVRLSDEDEG